ANIAKFDTLKDDLGYGLLLKRYTPNVVDATEEQIQKAVKDSFPRVGPMFWSFRIMVGCGVIMLVVFALSFYYNAHRVIEQKRWLLKAALWSIP
uniref:cytochrome ubiquinol oxidase subunit I n=2 Tax=Bacteria TaxID=2 RepID=UPI0038F609AC